MKKTKLFLYFFIFTKVAYSQEPCASFFRNAEGIQEVKQQKKVIEIKNGQDLFHWISNPPFNWHRLKEPAIEKAFILALKYSIDPSNKGLWDFHGITQYNLYQLKENFDWLKEHLIKNSHSKKESFPDFAVQVRDVRDKNSLIKELQDFSNRQVKSGHEVMQILFNIKESLQYWKEKIFQGIQGEGSLLKEGEFKEFIDLLDSLEKKEKLKKIFYFLNDKRENFILEGRKSYHISKMIVDLIHYAPAFYQSDIFNALKSNNLLEKVQVMRHLMNEREKFITELKLELNIEKNLFEQVLKKYNTPMPSGYSKTNEMEHLYEKIKERIDFQSLSVLSEPLDSFHVQHLSDLVSPFRGYLGFTCASCHRINFVKALEPNYHYFTINQKGYLRGYIEVQLGKAFLNWKKKKIAIVQRLQNIPNHLLSVTIEALRQSVLTKGYVLVRNAQVGVGGTLIFSHDKKLTDEFSKIRTGKKPLRSVTDGMTLFQIQDLASDSDVENGILRKTKTFFLRNKKERNPLIPRIHSGNHLSLTNIKIVDTHPSYNEFDLQLNLDFLVQQMSLDLFNQAKEGNLMNKLKYVSFKYAAQKLNGVKHLNFEEVLADGFEFRLALFLVLTFENGGLPLEIDLMKIFSREEITSLLKDRSFLHTHIEEIKNRFLFETIVLASIWHTKFINLKNLIELLRERELLHLSNKVLSYFPYKNRLTEEAKSAGFEIGNFSVLNDIL